MKLKFTCIRRLIGFGHSRSIELADPTNNHQRQTPKDAGSDVARAPGADNEHVNLSAKLSEKRREARKILYDVFSDRFNEACNEFKVIESGSRLTHAGHISCQDDLEDRPTFFSRIEGDHQHYLCRHEGAGLAHMQSTAKLKLINLGNLDMHGDPRLSSFMKKLPSFSLSPEDSRNNEFERNKNLAFLEWVAIRFKPGDIHGWWRGEFGVTEDILLISPRVHLDFVSHETAEAYHARI